MSQEWVNFSRAIDLADEYISRKVPDRKINTLTASRVGDVFRDLRFLCTFIGYFDPWHRHAASSSSSADIVRMGLALATRAKAAAKEMETHLNRAGIDIFDVERSLTSNPTLVNLMTRGISDLFRSLDSKLLRFVDPLREEISTLKREINDMYRRLPRLKRNLKELDGLLTPSWVSRVDSPCKVLIRILNSLDWVLKLRSTSVGDYDNQSWFPSEDNLMADQFVGMLLHIAHFYCLCWFNLVDPIDRNSEVFHMCHLIKDLYHEMDPPTPESLDIVLGSLGNYYVNKTFITSFVDYIIGIKHEFELVRNQLLSLFTCLIKIPHNDITMEDVRLMLIAGVKDVVIEAGPLKSKRTRGYNLLTLSKDNHLNSLSKGCGFLHQVSRYIDRERETESPIVLIMEGIPSQVKSLYQSSSDEEVHLKVSIFLFKSLVHMLLIRANAHLPELLEKDASLLMPPLKHNLASLQSRLLFLMEVVTDKTKKNTMKEKLILKDIEGVASGAICLYNQFAFNDNLAEVVIKDVDLQLLGLLQKVEHLKTNLGGSQIPKYHVPKTPGLCFIEFLVQNMRDLLDHNRGSIAYATPFIKSICSDMDSIISTFPEVFEEGIQNHERCHILMRLVELAYQAELAVGLALNKYKDAWQHALWLDNLLDEIRQIKKELTVSYRNDTSSDGVCKFPLQKMPVRSVAGTRTVIEEVMVGLNEDKDNLINRLIRGTQQREIVSIVGMPGVGKTTLANNVFRDQNVTHHFHIRAWSCISQNCKKRDLFLDILTQISTTDETYEMKGDDDIEQLLYRQLKGKRYLVVMDDMWSTEAWEDLQRPFQDGSNGSRILVTSRLKDAASKISSDPHPLCPLSEEESWELLKLKVFRKEECPQELLEVGMKIAKNCKGLPLAIGEVAGVLNRSCGRNRKLWNQIAHSFCLMRAKDDNFLLTISADDEPYSYYNGFDHTIPLEFVVTSDGTEYKEYRLSFCVYRKHFVLSKPLGTFVRSLLFFAPSDMHPQCPYDVSFIPINYRRLRVLDLETINMRYLAVCGNMESIPPSLSNLENLQTLIVKSFKDKVVLPETIWRMKKLRHIHVTNNAFFTGGYRAEDQMPNLVSLSSPCFALGEVTDKRMTRFPNLRRLRCIVLNTSKYLYPFPAIESLCKLESLNMIYHGKVLEPNDLTFPSSIKKLTLSQFRLPWSHISVIGRLPNLEILKLKSKAFEGSTWTMEEGEFLKLKHLKLDTLDIVHWDAFSDHLPMLRYLIVRKCKQLEEIPSDFAYISTLETIEVHQCGMSVEESVRRIEEQEIDGLKRFVVILILIVVSQQEIVSLYQRFCQLDRNGIGFISADEFLSVPEFAVNPLSQRLLRMLEGLNFKEFVSFLSAFSSHATLQQKLEFIFKVYDSDGNGKVTFNEMLDILRDLTGQFISEQQREQVLTKVLEEAGYNKDSLLVQSDFMKILGNTDIRMEVEVPVD
ncbi:OLC1v1035437C1 [Oldenlandia corymbosa var. corymbosa]|uniref:OLC1v1035437C1 n=1 Tax=Oldenlandia corymbosa var. corymbosa TaxID=529605 RepID=A0AAV1CVH4_OLDCO|nr:OLC1v1035437C1 [Oldenlandia corymbosa var. corymbosa]